MNCICGDNRFETIERYKKELIEGTNIEGSPEEMAVIDSILFRFWQMGWLKEQEAVKPTYEDFLGNRVARCGNCNGYIVRYKYCPGCGKAVKWE